VAQEAARHLNVAGLVLIATCRSNRGLPLPYRLACRLAGWMPLWAIYLIKPLLPHVRVLMGIRRNELVEWFADMIRDTDPSFLRWSLTAIARWPGAGTNPVPTVHIHGSADWVIPVKWNRPTHLIPHAGHVCNVTHAAEVNKVIDTFIHSVCAGRTGQVSRGE
jgi:pimeloyl-ACP methyl ester carboxylesterase